MRPNDVKLEEMTPTVIKYRLRDLEDKISNNHSEVLNRLDKIDTKINLFSRLEIEQVKMKKDIQSNEKGVTNLWKGIFGMGAVVFGGLVKFLFEFIKLK